MIVIDGSAFLALVNNVADSAIARELKTSGGDIYMAHTTGLETTFRFLGESGVEGIHRVQTTIRDIGLIVVPTTEEIKLASLAAFERFGEGKHPLSHLTIGDCAAYALAASLGARLISETDHFSIAGVPAPNGNN